MQDYIGSLLSDISYLNEGFFVNGKLTEEGAKKRTISEEARIFFNEHFTMVDQSFGGIGELISGFSGSTLVCDKAIVIRNETIMEQGTLSVLYRGTEKDQDFITDFTMAVGAADELSSALNYYIKNMNVENINDFDIAIIINQINNFGNNSYLSLIGLQRENALDYFKDLITANPNAKVNVYGHSLGGYLANYVTIMGENYHNINKTITFNAPGFNYEQLSVIEILQNIEILRDSITSNDLKSKLQAGLDKIIEVSEKHYNTASLDKLNSIYSTTGPEFTTNDSLGMFHPELRIPLYTDDAGAISNHFVQYLREALPIYESLNMIMGGDKLVNYHTLSELFNSYQNPSKNHENKLISIMNYIFDYLDIENSFNNTFDILNYFSNLSQGDLNKLSYEKLTSSNYNDSPTHLYALFNLAPFVLIKDYNVFENPMYDINNYTKKNIDDRYDLYQKYQNAKDMKIIKSSIQSMGIYENYNIVYDDNENDSSYLIFDEYNKTIITNDYISVNSSFDFTGDELGNIKTTYFKSYQSTLIVNTLNNKVYDTYLDDNIALNKGETTLDLSYGNDTVMIDVAAGATLKNVTIKDGGVGDLFIFNGGAGSDFIQGTQYNDKIIGGAGDDHLFAGVGNDTIDGGLGSDIIFGEDGDDILIGGDGNDMLMGGAGSNSLSGGDGDDTLNAYNTLDEYHDIRGDVLSGGSGTNSLFGTGYGDTYIYGGGIDTIRESDKHYGVNYVDKLKFASNVQTSQVSLYNILNNLVIAINGLNKIFVIDYYNNNYSYLDEIHFINPITGYSIIWDTNYILQHTVNTSDNKVIIGTNDAETINGTEVDNYIEGRDGNDIINGGKGNDKLYGDNGNDTINGGLGNDEIYGGLGNDILNGNEGNDIIYGEDGDDTINGGLGADILYGDIGNDTINGGGGGDTIYGGDGNDIINKNESGPNNIIIGGSGDDEIYGTFGNETYHYTYGDGNDTIYETATNATYIDILYLHQITPDDVEIYRQGINTNDIFINIKSKNEYIIIKNYYQNNGTLNYLDQIIFDNGVIWKTNEIVSQAKNYKGTELNDKINISNSLLNVVDSGGGDDVITNDTRGTIINSGSGNDNITNSRTSSVLINDDVTINSGDGDDTITSSGNNIVIDSGAGIDTIRSTMNGSINAGTGNDKIYLGNLKETIIYNIGDGQDTISTTGSGGDVFKITGYNKIDISKVRLSGKGKVVEIKFSEQDGLILTNYINVLGNINNTITFNFDDGIMFQNELKDFYTIITQAELSDNKFYDTIFSDQITGTIDGDNINIINGNGGTGFDMVNSGDGVDTITNQIDNTVINAGNDGDIIYTYGKNVTINGDGGDDKIYISSTYVGSGYINGGLGNDTISFQNNINSLNNYVIEGGWGNDTINMSNGTETIIFKIGDGEDTINVSGSGSASQSDKLVIKGYSKNDITSDNFLLYNDGKSVVLKLSETDSIKLVNFLYGKTSNNNLQYFEFDDGVMTTQQIIDKISQIKGTAGNDIIYDTVFNDSIDMTSGGNDKISLKSGGDVLYTGDDLTYTNIQSSYNTINAGSGDDTFFVEYSSINTVNLKSSNNGNDNISFGYIGKQSTLYVNVSATINIADTSVKGNYYKLSWGNNSSLSLSKEYINNQVVFNYGNIDLDSIKLVGDDGDNYLSAISSKGQTIYGNGGVDTIYGSINNDIIHGGLGNDKLYGQKGDDTIYGDDGDDLIGDTEGNNTIYGGDGNDTIYIGTGNDVVYGGSGNDLIQAASGLSGYDVIYGGDGDDTIIANPYYGEFYGQNGNDTYNIYKGLVVDYSGSNTLIFQNTTYVSADIRKTSTGFQMFKDGEVLVDYQGIVNKIEVRSPSPDGYGKYASLVGNEINKLFELQAALLHETENDNSAQKINELRSQMNYLWRTDTQ